MKHRSNNLPQRRQRVGVEEFEFAMAVVCVNLNAMIEVTAHLTPDHVKVKSPAIALVYDETRKHYAKYDALPERVEVETQIAARLNNTPELLTQEELQELDTAMEYFFAPENKKAYNKKSARLTAVETIRRHLEDFVIDKFCNDALGNGGETPVSLPAVLRDLEASIAIPAQLAAVKSTKIFPENWDRQAKIRLNRTGLVTFDRFLGGGIGDGEVILFMGPYGSCKTTLSIQVSVNYARKAAADTARGRLRDGKKPVVFFISTEMTKQEAQLRLLSNAAVIPRKRLMRINSIADLSHNTSLSDDEELRYEHQYFSGNVAGTYISEFDRAAAAIQLLNEHFIFIDCTGNDPDHPGAGSAGVTDIAVIVQALLRNSRDITPCFFCLDHASALAVRMGAVSEKSDQQRHALRSIPLDYGTMLAKKYGVPSLLLHQLSGATNGLAPTAVLHHTDAAECKAVAEFADFSILTGSFTEDERRLAKFRCTKYRREPPRGHAIVQLDGSIGLITDVTNRYVVDVRRKTFIEQEEMTEQRQRSRRNTTAQNSAVDGLDV